MSRRLILFSTLAVGMALLLAVRSSSPLVLDLIVRSVEVVVRAPYALLFALFLLGLTIGAGAWATVTGIRTHGKRVRISRRRRLRA